LVDRNHIRISSRYSSAMHVYRYVFFSALGQQCEREKYFYCCCYHKCQYQREMSNVKNIYRRRCMSRLESTNRRRRRQKKC